MAISIILTFVCIRSCEKLEFKIIVYREPPVQLGENNIVPILAKNTVNNVAPKVSLKELFSCIIVASEVISKEFPGGKTFKSLGLKEID